MALHLYTCHSCGHFDASLRRGIRHLRRTARGVDLSPGFRERLRARIALDATPPAPSATPRGSGLGLAALLILVAAAAMALGSGPGPAEQPLAIDQPAQSFRPMVVVNPGVPFVTFTDLSVPVFEHRPSQQFPVPLELWSNLPR